MAPLPKKCRTERSDMEETRRGCLMTPSWRRKERTRLLRRRSRCRRCCRAGAGGAVGGGGGGGLGPWPSCF